MKSKNQEQRILYPERLSLKFEGEIRSFPEKKKQRSLLSLNEFYNNCEMAFFKTKKRERERKDGSEIGGSRVHFPLNTGETRSQSTEEQSEQPTAPQHL